MTYRFSHSGLGTACFALLLGSTLLVAAPAAAAPGDRGRPAAMAPAATGQASKTKIAVAEADPMATSSLATSSLTKATDEEPACARPRRRLWVEGEGWVVRRVSACH